MINCFKNVKSPQVLDKIEFTEFLEEIKNPKIELKEKIEKARAIYKTQGKTDHYNQIKTDELPCYTLNFTFKEIKANKNIEASTGLIYIDIDDDTEIDLTNEYIYASWRSLSGTGKGIAVKVKNLSIKGFKEAYLAISEHLGINADINAAKGTQFTVLSYDPELYFNENALVWEVPVNNYYNLDNTLNTPISYVFKNRERKDVSVLGGNIIYDNLSELDFKGKSYLAFLDKKYRYAQLFIPKKIKGGNRNNTISSVLNQFYALNSTATQETIQRFAYYLNRDRSSSPLPNSEIKLIIAKTLSNENPKPILNRERRVIFNPKSKLSKKEKAKITAQITGSIKRKQTIQKIENIISEWSVEKDDKISQKKLAEKSGHNIKTIEKYYKLFKQEIAELKAKYKALE